MRDELIRKLNLDPLKTVESVEEEKANWENGYLERGIEMDISPFDNDDTHLAAHISKIQDPHFIEMAQEQEMAALEKHIQLHEQAIAAKQQEAAAQQAAMGGMPQELGPMADQGGMPMPMEDLPAEAGALQ